MASEGQHGEATFFRSVAPEKLDRIAAYLSERLTRELNRHRYGYVCIAMEALEQLLLACHCQSINLLVESFPQYAASALEADKPHLHILATNSFVKFATSRRTHAVLPSQLRLLRVSLQIRVSGIRVFRAGRKTVDDGSGEHLGASSHGADCPRPAVNLQQHTHTNSESPAEQTESRTPTWSSSSSWSPWTPTAGAAASVRAGIVEVLSEAAVIEARFCGSHRCSRCSHVTTQLRQSVDYELTGYYDNAGKRKTTSLEEKTLRTPSSKPSDPSQHTSCLPEVEVMLFIMGKIPVPGIYPALGSPNAGYDSLQTPS
ncbi:hypothetical protein INR49_022787 [Caranx melampygus]|nr:hypothetical protein INR49_022787 [Caranx melampygus]